MRKSFPKISNSLVERTIDSDTGEILNEEVTINKFIANSREEFFIGYVTLLSVLKDISGPAIKVYAYLLMNYKPGTFIGINKPLKKLILEFIGSSANVTTGIDNCLSELTKNKLLFKPEDQRGGYYLNPRYAFKGSTHDRNQSLKAIIELGCIDC